MAYKAKQLKSNEIPVNSNGASLGASHQLYKNAIVYVDASMDSVLINNVTHYYVYTYGRTSDGYLNSQNLQEPVDVNTSIYPSTCTTLPNGYLTASERANRAQSISSSSDDLAEFNNASALQYAYLTAGISDVDYNLTNIRSALGIFGLPYQFMPHVDMRMAAVGSASGRNNVYNDELRVNNGLRPSSDLVSEADELGLGYRWMYNIYDKMPLLLMTPGKANFLNKYTHEQRESVVQMIASGFQRGADNAGALSDVFEKEGRYYEFNADLPTYYNYVNPMCRAAAIFLGIGDKTIDDQMTGAGTPLKKASWDSFTSTRLQSFQDLGDTGFVGFYIDTPTEIRESFSNQTSESSLKGMADSISEQGKELNFLFGYGASALDINDTEISNSIAELANDISRLTSKNNILNSITKHLQTVASGGRLVFPEIWSNSSFDKSYNIDIKLISPDADKLSIYLNIIVPLMHLIAFAAPRTKGKNTGGMNQNAYFQPFLVRAVYKSMFSVDTGIITSMDISKGDEGKWTPDGLPTSVTVSFTIKDLYQVMSISPTEYLDGGMLTGVGSDTYCNTTLMDYIGTLCGVNIFQPDIKRAVDMWYMMNVGGAVNSIINTEIFTRMQNNIQNIVQSWWRGGY